MNVGFCKCHTNTDQINQNGRVMISNNGYDPSIFFNLINGAVIMRVCFNCKDGQTFYRLELRLIDKQLLDSMQVISLSQQRLSNCTVGTGLYVRYPRSVE